MPEPIFWKSKIFLAKIESAYGTDPTPTGAANAILATNLQISPIEGEDVSRDLEFPWLGAQETIPTGLRARLRFRVELQGSGTAGIAPAWGPLLRACAVSETIVSETSVTYAPVSAAMESVTAHYWIGGTQQVIVGMRGTATISLNAQGLPYADFDMLGLYAAPSEQTRPTPTLSGFVKPKVVTNTNTPTFTVDDVSLIMRSFSLALNNQVVPRLLVGSDSIIIPDRADAIRARVEAVPLTTLDPFAAAVGEDLIEVVIAHGTDAGEILTLTAPTCQLARMGELQQQDNITEWDLPITPLPASGNDQWSLALT